MRLDEPLGWEKNLELCIPRVSVVIIETIVIYLQLRARMCMMLNEYRMLILADNRKGNIQQSVAFCLCMVYIKPLWYIATTIPERYNKISSKNLSSGISVALWTKRRILLYLSGGEFAVFWRCYPLFSFSFMWRGQSNFYICPCLIPSKGNALFSLRKDH